MPILRIWDEESQSYQEIAALVGPQGPAGADGAPGQDGADGAAAKINGVNTLTITEGDGISITQSGSQMEIAAPDAITVSGGGAVTMNSSIGSAPYVIEVSAEEEETISAAQVSYDNTATGMTATNAQSAITELFTSVSEGKAQIAAAVTDKGVDTAATDSFQTMAANIGQIESGIAAVNLTIDDSDMQMPLGFAFTDATGQAQTYVPQGTRQTLQVLPGLIYSVGGPANWTMSGDISMFDQDISSSSVFYCITGDATLSVND